MPLYPPINYLQPYFEQSQVAQENQRANQYLDLMKQNYLQQWQTQEANRQKTQQETAGQQKVRDLLGGLDPEEFTGILRAADAMESKGMNGTQFLNDKLGRFGFKFETDPGKEWLYTALPGANAVFAHNSKTGETKWLPAPEGVGKEPTTPFSAAYRAKKGQLPQGQEPGMQDIVDIQNQLQGTRAQQGIGRTTEVGGRVKQFNPETQRYDIDVGPAPVKTIGVPGGTEHDPKDIAAAIMNGDQPPDMRGLYRYGAAVKAELARNKYNLTHANLDWQAVSRHVQTLNGPQQTRLRQSIDVAEELTDSIESIYKQLQSVAPSYGYKILNRYNLKLMKNLPGDAGALAQKLDTQISDLTADIANIYMGGYTPTDQGLKLASNNLASEWNPQTFKQAVDLLRTNVRIRKNSILSAGAIGAGGEPAQVGPVQQARVGTPSPTTSSGYGPVETRTLRDGSRVRVRKNLTSGKYEEAP